jgi:RNA polymerase sigma factor (sigma-70 family)
LPTLFDAAWRRRALRGDADSVRLFAEAMLQPLYAFCFHRVGCDVHRCEEVVQETLVRALRELERYDPARGGNNALWTRIDGDLLPFYERLEAEPLDEEVLRREETCELVNTTLAQLPPHYREALEAKYVRGVSVRDLAVLWSSTEKAVESQLTRARKAFRAAFLTLARNLGVETF